MKKLLFTLLAAGTLGFLIFQVSASDMSSETIIAEDEYSFIIHLAVPHVRNNSSSLGYRKFQSQTIKGTMFIDWMKDGAFCISFDSLENIQFKVGGKNVTYLGCVNDDIIVPRFNYIGDNKTGIFKTPCLCFYLELEPSYAIKEPTEYNSLYLLLAGKGSSAIKRNLGSIRIASSFGGGVAGTQGCSCTDYGDKSPTRVASVDGFSGKVVDVVATYGTWSARWKRRTYSKEVVATIR